MTRPQTRSVRCMAAGCLIGALWVGSAWSQGREVDCTRVPDNPACKTQQVPAHSGIRTVPGERPLKTDPSSTAQPAGTPVFEGQRGTGSTNVGPADPAPARSGTATIPGVTPITPATKQ